MRESWLAQWLIVLTFVMTVWRLSRALPAQNVIACVTLIILTSSIIQIIGVKTGVPFGPFFYTENLSNLVSRLQEVPGSNVLPWPVPLLWVIVLLNSRGLARLILKPWRGSKNFGLWLLALTCLLAMLFDVALEPFASRANQWWIWTTSKNVLAWYGAPWSNFAAWAFISLFILGFISPWLINKNPAGESPPDKYPLWTWLTLLLFLALGNASHQLWPATAFAFAMSFLVIWFAWRNSHA